MGKVILTAIVAASIIVVGIVGLLSMVIVIKGINQGYRWEEWSKQDDRKGTVIGKS